MIKGKFRKMASVMCILAMVFSLVEYVPAKAASQFPFDVTAKIDTTTLTPSDVNVDADDDLVTQYMEYTDVSGDKLKVTLNPQNAENDYVYEWSVSTEDDYEDLDNDTNSMEYDFTGDTDVSCYIYEDEDAEDPIYELEASFIAKTTQSGGVATPTPEPEGGEGEDIEIDGTLTEGNNTVSLGKGEAKTFAFVPSKTAKYYIYSNTNDVDTVGTLMDENGNALIFNDEADEADEAEELGILGSSNFLLVHELTAGKTYYVSAQFYEEEDSGVITIVCSDEFKGISDDAGNEEGGSTGGSTGNIDPSEIEVDGTLTEGNNTVSLSEEQTKIMSFVPTKTAKYYIYSNTKDADTYGILYDEDGNKLDENDDAGDTKTAADLNIGSTFNFLLSAQLTAGKTYYVSANFIEEDESGNIVIVCSDEYTGIVDDEKSIEDDENYVTEFDDCTVNMFANGNPVEDVLYGYESGESVRLSASLINNDTQEALATDAYTVKWYKGDRNSDYSDDDLISEDKEITITKSEGYEIYYCIITLNGKFVEEVIELESTKTMSADGDVTLANGTSAVYDSENDQDDPMKNVYARAEIGDTVSLEATGVSSIDNAKLTFTWYRDGDDGEELVRTQTITSNQGTDVFTFRKADTYEYYSCEVSDGNSVYVIYYNLESKSLITYNSSWKINGETSNKEVLTSADELEMIVNASSADQDSDGVTYEWSYIDADDNYYEVESMRTINGRTYYDEDGSSDVVTDEMIEMPFKLVSCQDGSLKISGMMEECQFNCYMDDGMNSEEEVFFNFYATTSMVITPSVYNNTKQSASTKHDIGDSITLGVTVTDQNTDKDITGTCDYQWYSYDPDWEEYEPITGEISKNFTYEITGREEQYRCMVTKKDGSERQPTIFTINANSNVNYIIVRKINNVAANTIQADYGKKVTLSVDLDTTLDKSLFNYRWYNENDKMVADSYNKTSIEVPVTKDEKYYCMVYYGDASDDEAPKRADFSVRLNIVADKSQCEHKNTEIIDKAAATCSQMGYTGNTYCKDCKQIVAKGEDIPKNPSNHAETILKNHRAATCGAAGYTGDTCCKDCGTVISKGKSVAATGKHTWNAGVITKQPTVKADGMKTHTCIVCKKTKTVAVVAKDLTQKITTAKIKSYKAKKLKKKKVTFSLKAKTSGDGKLTYKVTKGKKKYITVSKKGKVTLKKKCKKGTYKITITASATSKCKKATKVVKIKVK